MLSNYFLEIVYFSSSAYDLVLKEFLNLNKDEAETLRFESGSYDVSQKLLSMSQSNDHESNGMLEKNCFDNVNELSG